MTGVSHQYSGLIYVGVHVEIQGFPSVSTVKNQPARQEIQETQVQSPGLEDPLEET